jgi:hypothetical protein
MEDHIPRNGTRPDKEALAPRSSVDEEKEVKPDGKQQHRTPDPHRMRILRGLPLEIKQSLTREEADAFLYEETWPDSLLHKLKDFLVEEKKH